MDEEKAQRAKKYYLENRERILANSRRRRKYLHERKVRNAAWRRRKEREAAATNTLTDVEWEQILLEYADTCAYCGRHISDVGGRGLEREHVIPVSRGGGSTKENIVPACGECNQLKGAQKWELRCRAHVYGNSPHAEIASARLERVCPACGGQVLLVVYEPGEILSGYCRSCWRRYYTLVPTNVG